MADKTHEFFVRQHEHLNQLETSIVKTRGELEAAQNEAMDNLTAKRSQAAASRASFQTKITDSINQMKASVEARRAQGEAAVKEWKTKREVEKLEHRADDLEAYAEAAMRVLDIAQEEAAQASLDAIEARRVAVEARAAAGIPA
jgi:hypothetical protein